MSAVKRTTKPKARRATKPAAAPKPKARRAAAKPAAAPKPKARRAVAKPAAAPKPRARRAAAKPAAKKRWTQHLHDVNVVSYAVSDFERAKEFYGQTLGLPIAAEMPGVGWIEYGYPDQTHLAVSHWQGPEPMPVPGGGVVAIFSSEEAREAIESLRALGVRCDEVIEIPGMVIYGTFYDPEGNRLQVAQAPKQS
jgi:predicted enzyme related to lactoylglutathione lyase